MKSHRAILLGALWALTAIAIVGSLIGFVATGKKNEAFSFVWYCISGWCLIPLPFAIAATVASLIRGKSRPQDGKGCLRPFLWGIAILLLLFVLAMAAFLIAGWLSGGVGLWKD
jgi:hypothetical protein